MLSRPQSPYRGHWAFFEESEVHQPFLPPFWEHWQCFVSVVIICGWFRSHFLNRQPGSKSLPHQNPFVSQLKFPSRLRGGSNTS
jgi:hypothetical protein